MRRGKMGVAAATQAAYRRYAGRQLGRAKRHIDNAVAPKRTSACTRANGGDIRHRPIASSTYAAWLFVLRRQLTKRGMRRPLLAKANEYRRTARRMAFAWLILISKRFHTALPSWAPLMPLATFAPLRLMRLVSGVRVNAMPRP